MGSHRQETSEAELVARAGAGDEPAFERLVERHAAALERFAERRLPLRLRRRVSVADVLQEARIVALARCAEFRHQGDASFRNFLFGVVENKVREAVRAHEATAKRSLLREVTQDARPATGEFPGREPSPSEVVVGIEARERADRALRLLPEDYREILTLTRRLHLGLDEAALRMGRSREAARKLLSRAVARFAEEFDALRGTDDG